jgi:hypothetical protein
MTPLKNFLRVLAETYNAAKFMAAEKRIAEIAGNLANFISL